jgi:hypothetical protein
MPEAFQGGSGRHRANPEADKLLEPFPFVGENDKGYQHDIERTYAHI